MTPSRIAWFLGILVLVTPIVLAVYSQDDGITGGVIVKSLLWSAGLAAVNALLWGRKPRRREEDM